MPGARKSYQLPLGRARERGWEDKCGSAQFSYGDNVVAAKKCRKEMLPCK